MENYTKYKLKAADELASVLAGTDNLFVIACNKCFKEFETTQEPDCDTFKEIAAAQGKTIGTSLLDESKLDYCREMLKKAEEKGVKLLLPIDTVVAASFPDPIDGEIAVDTVDADAIPADKMGLDIGPKTRELFADAAKTAKTVVWNGPMGVFENPTLAKGTIAVAQALADSDAITIVGGGDSAAACEQLGFASKITHISTGGGASLEFLEGRELPGIACLLDK